MYRLEAIEDRISCSQTDVDNLLNKVKEAQNEFEEEIFLALYRDFDQHSGQQRIHALINRPDVIEELAVIFRIIDKKLDYERDQQQKGIGTYLLAIVMRNLLDSEQLWMKLVRIIGQQEHRTTLVELNKVLRRQCVMKRVAAVIQEYLKHLVQLGDDFFIDCDSIEDTRKRKFFTSIEVPKACTIINHLLTQADTSAFFDEQIFTAFELSPSFISYLKLCMRNLNL